MFAIILILSVLIPFCLIVWGGSMLNVLTNTAWTALFVRLNSKEVSESKIIRVFTKSK
jgi:hypothetical protein